MIQEKDDEMLLQRVDKELAELKQTEEAMSAGQSAADEDQFLQELRDLAEMDVPVVQNLSSPDEALPVDETEEIQQDETRHVPGWVKGLLILLASLIVLFLTFYAVGEGIANPPA